MNGKPQQAVIDYASPLPSWAETRFAGVRAVTWARIGTLGILFILLFWPNLRRLWLKTNPITGEPNWGHSVFVPLIGLVYLYQNRTALLEAVTRQTQPAQAVRPGVLQFQAWSVWLMLMASVWGIIFFVYAYSYTLTETLKGQLLVYGPAVLASVLKSILVVALPSWRGPAASRLRDAVRRLYASSSRWFGAYTLVWGILFYAWAIWPGQNDFFKDCAMVVALFGAVLLTCGWPVMRLAWFPILFLTCAIPWPQLVYSWVALPLQEMAAAAAVWTLKMTGVEAVRQGTKIVIGARVLNVAEACAGLKSLMTFITVAAAVAFLSARPAWERLVITASAVPIAIFCNMMRITGQGLLDHYVSTKFSDEFAHQFVGVFMLIPAFFLILLVGWLLDHLLIDDAAPPPGGRGRKAPAKLARKNAARPPQPPRPAGKAASLASAMLRLSAGGLSRPQGAAAADAAKERP